jgi:hypothetical protein
MASKSKLVQEQKTKEEIEEMIEVLGKLLDRTKVMYEQYFMGIQRIPPSQLHRDIERKIREITQQQIRNTSLRYRLTTMTQKYGSYNTYWRRIMREIEQGKYIRDIAKVGRRAAKTGKDIPPEILQAMPKRMRDRILRDREMMAKRAEREGTRSGTSAEKAPEKVRDSKPGNVHSIDMDDANALLDGDLDLDAMFAAITDGDKSKNALGSEVDSMFDSITSKTAPVAPVAEMSDKKPAPAPAKAQARPAPKRPAPRPPARPAAKKRSSAAPPPPGMSESDGRKLYDRYVKAKKLVGEKTDGLSYDKLMKSLSKKAPAIMSKHKASGVDFNVVVKDDRVILKAKPKK